MSIEIEDLVVGYGDEPVLEGVTFAVEPGELVGLVGPNGAGKTTLIRTALGALAPRTGTVRLQGDPVGDLSSKAASRRVAAVPQQSAVTFNFTVREVVEMGRHPHAPRLGGDPDSEAVERAMERTAVADLADRDIDAISGGERQRVLLARALAQDTPALLVDEPTASLDVNHQIRTLELVGDLGNDGRAVLAAIHDLNLAARYCDRLVVLADGAIQAVGPPERVLESDTLEAAFDTRAVVHQDPITAAPVVTALPEATGHATEPVHVVGTGEEAAAVVARLARAGYEVSAGVVPTSGQVATTADALGMSAITAPPFGDIPKAARRRARSQIREAAVTVVVSSSGVANRELVDLVDEARRLVLVGAIERGSEWGPVSRDRVDPANVVGAVTGALTEPIRRPVLGQET